MVKNGEEGNILFCVMFRVGPDDLDAKGLFDLQFPLTLKRSFTSSEKEILCKCKS